MTRNFVTTSVEETIALGRKLGKVLRPGDVVALDGDLGAGNEDVCSPTFTIVNEYTEPSDKIPLFHFDTYRLSGEDDFLAAGLDEYFYRGGVCVIEWSSVIEGLLPDNTIKITIRGNGDKRDITIDDPEERIC